MARPTTQAEAVEQAVTCAQFAEVALWQAERQVLNHVRHDQLTARAQAWATLSLTYSHLAGWLSE